MADPLPAPSLRCPVAAGAPCRHACRTACHVAAIAGAAAYAMPGTCPASSTWCVWGCGPSWCRDTCSHPNAHEVEGQGLDRNRRHVRLTVAACPDCGDLSPNLPPSGKE